MANTARHFTNAPVATQPAPPGNSGAIKWVRENLFSSPLNIFLTLLALYVLYVIVPPLVQWAFLDSIWIAESREDCWARGDGACWAIVISRYDQFIYGDYPRSERWRADFAFALLFVALLPILFDKIPHRQKLLFFSMLYPVVAYLLLVGGLGLPVVETDKFGGFLLTMVIGVTGISASLPLGILLALGRQSDLLILQVLCIGFIEFIRGVPLITLLFVASTLLNYFLPPGTSFDLLMRVLIMVTLFSSAYLAEVVRGGLAAIPKGQYEAGHALGLSYWKEMRLIILPQALKISIPGIVSSFIGLFKDSTLVIIIGMLDPLGIGRTTLSDAKWQGLSTEVYVFVAVFFFICCFSMSRYSIYLEHKLETGHKR
ncbi:MAG: amino acid ABC transporter permease [Alphaproteobacteria bacterium]